MKTGSEETRNWSALDDGLAAALKPLAPPLAIWFRDDGRARPRDGALRLGGRETVRVSR